MALLLVACSEPSTSATDATNVEAETHPDVAADADALAPADAAPDSQEPWTSPGWRLTYDLYGTPWTIESDDPTLVWVPGSQPDIWELETAIKQVSWPTVIAVKVRVLPHWNPSNETHHCCIVRIEATQAAEWSVGGEFAPEAWGLEPGGEISGSYYGLMGHRLDAWGRLEFNLTVPDAIP